MICPRCNNEMKDHCCIRCGYMTNGNFVSQDSSEDKYDDLRTYNNYFDEMIRNENSWLCFVLGPLYFSYRNHLLCGTILTGIHLFLFYLTGYTASLFLSEVVMVYLIYFNLFIYIILSRILYVMFDNILCIKIDQYQLKKYKNNHEDYQKMISEHEGKDILKVFLNIAIYLGILIIFMIYKRITNNM